MFPFFAKETTSWEGHLSGAIAGTICALAFMGYGPQRPNPFADEEEEKEERDGENDGENEEIDRRNEDIDKGNEGKDRENEKKPAANNEFEDKKD